MHESANLSSTEELPGNFDPEGSYALFELLLEGLDQPDKLLAQNCLYALAAVGASIIPHLRQLAGEVSTGRMFRQRLTVAIALIIETIERGEALNHSWIQTAVFDALRPNNPQLNQRAMSALQYLPTSILDGLITLAVVNSNNTDYCLRLLSASEKYNRSLPTSVHLDLFVLKAHQNAAIQRKVKQLVLKFRPQNQLIPSPAV